MSFRGPSPEFARHFFQLVDHPDVLDTPYTDMSTDEEDAIGNIEDTYWYIRERCKSEIASDEEPCTLRKGFREIIEAAQLGLQQVEEWEAVRLRDT